MAFNMRTSKPNTGNKFYNNGNNGGYSWCINGSPTDKGCNVLANCVGYACGRFNEIIGSMKYKTLCCNAENFIEKAKQAGLQVVSYPTLGGIMVWQKGKTLSGNDGAGHVAIVERIDSANQIYTSESGYGSSAFWNSVRKNNNGRWGLSSSYTFRGCIVNPAIGDVHYVAPVQPSTPSTGKFKIGDQVIINGNLYVNSNAASPAGHITNKTTKITRYAEGSKHPYNTTGDLGWMDESDIKLVNISQPSQTSNPQTVPIVDILTLVKKTIRGDFGNGNSRKKALGSNYDEVQKQVSLNYQHGTTQWDNIKLY